MGAVALRAPIALVRLFALVAICHATVQLDHGVVPIARKDHVPTSVTPSNASVGDIKTQLRICECQKATGSPNGLSCGEREGWFISSFEREGSWLSGGGLVPLSHAICCRPCLPDELPPTEAPIAKDDKPVGIMSMGCHASSGTGPFSLQCEPRGNSVVTGWAEAVLVSSSIDAYYPLGSAACCTPSLLLESGAAWELERCDCTQSGDIDCGGMTTHRFLTGFDRWRMTRIGQFVPVAPANCCKMCLSDTVRPLDRCEDLNMCSGHGMCVTGACECSPGYSGADCGVKSGFGYQGLPQWLISLIIMCSCATLCLFMLIGNRLIRFFHLRALAAEGEEGEQAQEPLLPGLGGEDDDGSVGSEDTTDDDSEADEAARLVDDALAVAAAEDAEAAQGDDDAASAAALDYMESPNLLNSGAAGAGSHSSIPDLAAPYSSAQDAALPAEQPQQPGEPHLPADPAAQTEAAHTQRMSAAQATVADAHEAVVPASNHRDTSGNAGETILDIPDKQEEAAGRRRHEKGEGPPGVPGRDCNVCMVRAVQVALIPCGHACMCRRCSRRLSRCPVCRKEILRRQRLFI